MSLSIKIQITDTLTPELALLNRKLSDRTELHAAMAPELESFTRNYVRETAKGRHKTATRLGASQTGHLTRAADAIESGHDSDGAYLTFPRTTGLSRAFYDYVLTTPTAKGKKWIALPAIASAYGRRPREFKDLQFIPFREDLAALVKRSKSDQKFMVVYWLKKKVTIKQDRTLLPDDESYTLTVELVASEFIDAIMKGDSA